MKRIVFTIFAMLLMASTKAQEGEIIYTDFDPDLTLRQDTQDSILLDIDFDGTNDLKFVLGFDHGFQVPFYHALNGWSIAPVNDSTVLNADTLPRPWLTSYEGPYNSYYGLRKIVGTDCYYGWFYTYDGQTKNSKGTRTATLFIDRMAYCTIPNYPLRAGQTSLVTGIDEPEATAFATVHPNPTNGLFTVTGKALKAAEVLNALGQRVATATGKGETMQIDIANLPAGVYFVRVTDEEGKKCVRKVVKF